MHFNITTVAGCWKSTAELLGRGSDAEVWMVTDPQGRSFALKLPRADRHERVFLERSLEREYRWLRRHSQPGLINVGPIVYVDGRAGYLMEMGCQDGRQVRRDQRDALVRQVSATIRALHQDGLTHGDISAANVLGIVDPTGRARWVLTDPRPHEGDAITVFQRLADVEGFAAMAATMMRVTEVSPSRC
jgi:RIO-like serine/threonine protein kinase